MPKSWGGVARRGAGRLGDQARDPGTDRRSAGVDRGRPEKIQPERWERVDDVRSEADRAAKRASAPRRSSARSRSGPEANRRTPRPAGRAAVSDPVERELGAAMSPARASRAARQLQEAGKAFRRDRFGEARTLLRPLAEQAPGSPSVRELLGLTYYRLGSWKLAARELEAFVAMTASTEQHPVLADCYRALGRWSRVDELWEELRAASPGADLVAEGRIVVAGSLADRGDLAGAIALLEEKARRPPRRARLHHLRVAYALADLYERTSDVARARELFGWVAGEDGDFADAGQRARALT